MQEVEFSVIYSVVRVMYSDFEDWNFKKWGIPWLREVKNFIILSLLWINVAINRCAFAFPVNNR